ncbi:MAG: hypothetical protein ACTTKN_10360 [Phocaeicola sp.]|uniref:hypothetical protein n=1 Tax=Phocaeicola sp. TaxID=2773926 RepID=UPI003FA0A54C
MNKYMNRLLIALLAVFTMSACTDEEGTNPGGDGSPSVILYQYDAESPNDPDTDSALRIAVNNKTADVYYFAEPTSSVSGHGATTEAYADYVVANGTKAATTADENNGGYYADVVVTNMKGDYTISAVAVSGNEKAIQQKTFFGKTWVDVSTGTYYFSGNMQKRLGVDKSVPTTLQSLESDPNQYRFKNLYGAGYSLILTKTDVTGADDNDALQFFRVADQALPFSSAKYGTISVRDLGYWQNDDSFAYDPGYGVFMYTDKLKGNFVLNLQLHVTAGSFGFDTDQYVPN